MLLFAVVVILCCIYATAFVGYVSEEKAILIWSLLHVARLLCDNKTAPKASAASGFHTTNNITAEH